MIRISPILPVVISSIIAAAQPCVAAQASNKPAGNIVITITDIRIADGGNLIVSLYDGKENWLKTERARITEIVPIEGDSSVVALKGVPYDNIYAVAVIHDKNRNGKLDMRRFPWPKPKEGAGISNNRFSFGPPDYRDARIELSDPVLKIRIGMRY
jgi:uncharacterized protein (DUF2141 family)